MSNHFDNEKLFEKYIEMRKCKDNYTDMIAKPASLNLLSEELKNKTVLDLCCGFGESSRFFSEHGAKEVVGIDISQKMINEAIKRNSKFNIYYICADVMTLNPKTNNRFDIVYSAEAFHFIENLDVLFKKINILMKENGIFVFSIEHPIMTSPIQPRWQYDENGKATHFLLKDYFSEGERNLAWFSNDISVTAYHRKFSTIINLLIKNNFTIEEIVEPEPKKDLLNESFFNLTISRPSTIVIKCKKGNRKETNYDS